MLSNISRERIEGVLVTTFDFEEDGDSYDGRSEIQQMKDKMAEMRNRPAPQEISRNPSRGAMFPGTSTEEVLARLNAVETRETTGETCTLGGTSFTSANSVAAYITEHDITLCAMYWDLFSIMVCMGGEGLMGKERSDRIYSAQKGRAGSALEGELVRVYDP
jgi:hypothetical protein